MNLHGVEMLIVMLVVIACFIVLLKLDSVNQFVCEVVGEAFQGQSLLFIDARLVDALVLIHVLLEVFVVVVGVGIADEFGEALELLETHNA